MPRLCIRPDWPAPAAVTALTTLRGGGHSLAAGYSANGPIDDVVAALAAALG